MSRLRHFYICLPALLIVTAVFLAQPPQAQAATRLSVAPAKTASGSPNQYQAVSSSTTTTSESISRDAAGDPCRARAYQINNNDIFGVTLFWFKMTTSYCYNHVYVTSHHTTLAHGVDLIGEIGGWEFLGYTPIKFHCFVTEHNTHPCAGNFEAADAYFYNTLTTQLCKDHIYEEEYYDGRFLAHTSTNCSV